MDNIPLEEQETTINLYPRKVSDQAEIYSCDPTVIKKLDKLSKKTDGDMTVTKRDKFSIQANVPRDWVKISPPRKVNMTEEQRKAAAERLKAAREAKLE